jgi:hypothetical protein
LWCVRPCRLAIFHHGLRLVPAVTTGEGLMFALQLLHPLCTNQLRDLSQSYAYRDGRWASQRSKRSETQGGPKKKRLRPFESFVIAALSCSIVLRTLGLFVARPVSILKLVYAHSNEHVGSILIGHICLEWNPRADNDCSCDEKSTEYCAADVVIRWRVKYDCDPRAEEAADGGPVQWQQDRFYV